MNFCSKGIVAVSACVFLSGCVATPPDSRMVAVADMAPGSWTASKEGKSGVDRLWVQRFGDSKLTRLVEEAVTRNPDMKIAAERVQQARYAARIAGSDGRPTANLDLTGEKRKIQFVGFPFGGSQIANSYSSEFRVNWDIDLWGRVRASSSAAMADAQATELDRKAAEASLAAEVCKAWFALAEARQQVALVQDSINLKKRTVEAVRDRFERNLQEEGGTASQLRLAQTDLATTMATLSERQGELEAAQRRLELLVGRYPAGKVIGRAVLPKMPSKVPSGVPSGLLQRRPDVISAERRFAAAGMRLKEAKLAVFPVFSLTGTTGTSTDSLIKVVDSDFGVWSLSGNLSQAILTGGVLTAERDSRASKEREELANLQQTVLKAFGEVENALAAEKWLKRRITELEKANKLAKEAAESADQDYRDSTGDVLTLLETQGRKIDIASQLVRLKRLQLDNRVDLHLALGGGFYLSGK
ncbi:outer membrane protein OprM [Rubritalea halochordaticola]|uniref:Outer membrane protein OprM n=1 Tax=Rubritalea halochordaticola TaxID=714537 RepID=A0ABP9UTY1_9BACT